MCRAPEIVEHVGKAFPSGPDVIAFRCVNCERWAHLCPICNELRCSSDLHLSMIGSIPLACKVCRPNGVRQVVTFGAGPGSGPYRAGTRLEVDDPEIEGFEMTGPPT